MRNRFWREFGRCLAMAWIGGGIPAAVACATLGAWTAAAVCCAGFAVAAASFSRLA